jgi:hypothetical protein
LTPLLDDRFLLLENLGSGGMGRVLRAFDRVEERVVALKIHLRDERPGPGHPLAAEWDAWSRLRHPNIVKAYELGRADRGPLPRGTPYLVLESFPGAPADRALHPGSETPDRLAELARKILQALCHVHRAGLVHRDLKPGNVLVGAARRGPGRVKLTDFGLAAPIGRAGRPGCVSGSVPYLAPEAVLGEPVDGRADLYGLGILLFLLATGRMPVDSRDPGEILRWHLEGPPADPRELRPDHPDRLARFVRRLTARDPGGRPGSAEEALLLLGGPRVPPPRPVARTAGAAEVAALRLALDAARLGARRFFVLPAEGEVRRSLVNHAKVFAQTHAMTFHRLCPDPRTGVSCLGRLVLQLLLKRGPGVGEVIARHGLHRGLPLGVLGGLPVWDRLRDPDRSAPDPEEAVEATAKGVASFVIASSEREAMVLLVERPALADRLARRVVERLLREESNNAEPARGGLLLLLPRLSRRCSPGT